MQNVTQVEQNEVISYTMWSLGDLNHEPLHIDIINRPTLCHIKTYHLEKSKKWCVCAHTHTHK